MSSQVDLVRATDVAEASEALHDTDGAARILNGGTEIARQLREGELICDVLVDVKGIGGFHDVSRDNGTLSIGAAVKHWDIGEHPLLREAAPALAEACGHLGNLRVRAQGSLGGNLAYGHAQTDPGTALVALGGTVHLASHSGTRAIDIEDLWVSDCRTTIRPDELCTRIDVPAQPEGWLWGYRRVEVLHRPPSVNVALLWAADGDEIADLRIGVGAVGERPTRLHDLERRLRGVGIDQVAGQLRSERDLVAEELEPEPDQVFSAQDKVDVTCNLLVRLFRDGRVT